MMSITLRPFDEATDYPRLVAVANTGNEEPTTEDRERAEFATHDKTRPYRYQTALWNGEAVGFCYTNWTPWEAPGEFTLLLRVDSAKRGSGVGRALYADAENWAREQGIACLKAAVRDNDPDSLAFSERRGFVRQHHTFRSHLDLSTFNEAPFAEVIASKEAEGIRFFNLATIGYDEETKRRVYELSVEAGREEPTMDGYFPTYEQFCENVYHSPWFLPEGPIIAADGENWIGIAVTGRFPDSDRAFNAFTGVRPQYRGRKIALALKLQGIRLAQRMGATLMWTSNDSRNAPMLAVNQKLGYVPQPGLYRMRLEL
jgi:GNAT superfamily N-acetyltransferase